MKRKQKLKYQARYRMLFFMMVAGHLLLAVSAFGDTLAWEKKLFSSWVPFFGYCYDAKPVIYKDSIILATGNHNDRDTLVVLSRANGNEKYRVSINVPSYESKPLIDVERGYFISWQHQEKGRKCSRKLEAIDLDSGKKIWSHSYGATKLGMLGCHGNDDLSMSGDLVFSSFWNNETKVQNLAAIEIETGTLIWSKELDKGLRSDVILNHDLLYFVTQDGFVQVLNRESGETKKTFAVFGKDPGKCYKQKFVKLQERALFVCGGDLAILDLSSDLTNIIEMPYSSTEIYLSNDQLIVFNRERVDSTFAKGELYAVDPKFGNKRHLKSYKYSSSFNFSLTKGYLAAFIGSGSGLNQELSLLDLSSGETIWTKNFKNTDVGVRFSSDYLFSAEGESIKKYEILSGKELAKTKVGRKVTWDPYSLTSDSEKVYAFSQGDCTLRAIK